MATSVCIPLCIVALSALHVAGLGFARPPTPGARRAAHAAELRDAFTGGRRRAPTETDLSRIEEVLEPIYLALPKNVSGYRLGASAARYALHRAFVQLHGWRVKGLDHEGGAWADLSPSLHHHEMPEEVRGLFEERLARGVDLFELASVAAALEHVLHSESESRLKALYAATARPLDATLVYDDATELVDAYVGTFVLGMEAQNITSKLLKVMMPRMPQLFAAWAATRSFARELQTAMLTKSEGITFEDVEVVVEEFSQRYGRWQNSDCMELKADLIGLEENRGNARVRLSDFYHATLYEGKWFNESPEFLLQQGALDDSDPDVPRVVIPNYLYSPANCVANMRYYSVCCIDECEDLFGRLERHFKSPVARPEAIARFVGKLPSSSMSEGRNLAPALIARLKEIAAPHGGQVPLHGRLFAQWMHHAYPRECPFPHVSGTTTPRSAKEFQRQMGRSSKVAPEEMERHAAKAQGVRKEYADDGVDDDSVLPWHFEEELVDPHAHRAVLSRRGRLPAVLRFVAFAGALGSMFASLVSMISALWKSPGDGGSEKGGDAPLVHFV